jgi:hypothetical protein
MVKPAKGRHAPAEKRELKSSVTVQCDVGFGNGVYIRGQGGGLSWEKGVLLENRGADTWVWETTQLFTNCEFKVLLNDQQYETGDNHWLPCGASVQYRPVFF